MTDVIKQLLIESVRDPRAAAPKVLALPLNMQVWGLLLGLVIAMNAVVYGLFLSIQPPLGILPQITNNPLGYALATGGMFAALVLLFDFIGRMMGGQGDLRASLVVVTWLQALQLIVLTALSLMGLVLGGLASLVSLVFSVYFFWMLMCFLNAAHQFNSLGRSFALMLLGHFGAAFALSFLLVLTGFSPVGPV